MSGAAPASRSCKVIGAGRTRARYRPGSTCLVAGRAVDPAQLSVRSMNFGQAWRTPGIVDFAYDVALPAAFWRDFLGEQLPALVDDCRRWPDPDEPFERALGARGWPSAETVAADPTLGPMALEWWGREALVAWFGDGEPEGSPGYIMNTIEALALSGGAPRITGYAREAGMPARFQDF